jgi:hypothetical protein
MPDCLGCVGPAHTAAALRGPLFLVQATPGAILFRPGNGVVEAFRPNRAGSADHLGLTLTDLALWLPLTIGAEEEHDLLASARGGILPGPARPRRHGHLPTYLRHESISSNSRVFLGQASAVLLDPQSHAMRPFTPSIHPTHCPVLVFPRIRTRSATRAKEIQGQSCAGRSRARVTRKPSRRSQPVQPNRRSIVPSGVAVPQPGGRIGLDHVSTWDYRPSLNDHQLDKGEGGGSP